MTDEEITGRASEGETAPETVYDAIRAAVDAQDRAREPAADADSVEADAGAEEALRAQERARDERGRFAKAEGGEEPAAEVKPEGQAEPVAAAEEPTEPAPEPDESAALRPPPGWPPAAKVAFEKLPPEVKQAVAQREIEVNNGFAKLAEYKPIERYAEMAKSSGTTLDKALESYVGIENLLRRDIFAGVEAVLRNAGVHPQQFLSAYAARQGLGGEQPVDGQPTQAQMPAFDPDALRNQILQDWRREQALQTAQSAVERAKSDPSMPFFANVEDRMDKLINAGLVTRSNDHFDTLKLAYQTACQLDPEISALIKQQSAVSAPAPTVKKADPVAQARQAAKAIGGAPTPGFKPAAPPPPENFSAADAVRMQLGQ